MAIAAGSSVSLAVTIGSASPHECKLVDETLAGRLLDEPCEKPIGDTAYDIGSARPAIWTRNTGSRGLRLTAGAEARRRTAERCAATCAAGRGTAVCLAALVSPSGCPLRVSRGKLPRHGPARLHEDSVEAPISSDGGETLQIPICRHRQRPTAHTE